MHDIQLFGRLEVRTRGLRLAGRDFGGIKPRHILALLALRGPLAKAELTELLWDGRPPAIHEATVSAVRAAACSPHATGGAVALLRRAAELAS